MSIAGCARKNPVMPPLTNIEMNPKANRDAELIRNFDPYKLPIQMRVKIVAGIVMMRVGNEKTKAENGFIPLTNI